MKRFMRRSAKRGAVVVYVAISAVVMVGFGALAIDIGIMSTARTDLQASADAAALSGTVRLLNEARLKGQLTSVMAAARAEAVRVAGLNEVLNDSPYVDANSANSLNGDVVLGYLSNPLDLTQPMSTATPSQFNSVRVRVRRDAQRNGSITAMFANALGVSSMDAGASATATFQDGIVGYHVTDATGNAELLPLALRVSSWNNLLNGSVTSGDNYTYHPDTGAVTSGPDGIIELNIYPGAGAGQLPPGNFGTVDIGNPNNSTADISRQIREGVSASDLAYFGGTLDLGDDGAILLNGDTGLSAAIKDDLEFIKGRPRAIPLFNSVSGNGNNAFYNVVGFAGIRIMYVKLTGAMSGKKVIVQPAYVVDGSAISRSGGTSYYVYRPPMLSR